MQKPLTLTKQQRFIIYQDALSFIKNCHNTGICYAVRRYLACRQFTDFLSFFYFYEKLPFLLPELYAHKPDDKPINDYWWPSEDRQTRIKVLESCIEQTK